MQSHTCSCSCSKHSPIESKKHVSGTFLGYTQRVEHEKYDPEYDFKSYIGQHETNIRRSPIYDLRFNYVSDKSQKLPRHYNEIYFYVDCMGIIKDAKRGEQPHVDEPAKMYCN